MITLILLEAYLKWVFNMPMQVYKLSFDIPTKVQTQKYSQYMQQILYKNILAWSICIT